MTFSSIRQTWYSRLISSCLVVTFVTTMVNIPYSFASQEVVGLPAPGTMVNLSPAYVPLMITGLSIHPENPLLMDFIVSTGNSGMNADQVKKQSDRLIKYFLACLTIPENNQWVNLSPYEKDRIIPEDLGQTVLGQDMLAQDYLLKQLTASLIYPEKNLGKDFWDKVYAKARQMYGTTQVPVNTFNKVWILPEYAKVYEHKNTVILVQSHLKVMLDADYLSLTKHGSLPNKTINNLGSEIVRQIILPAIEQEVNTGKNFAQLRQIYNSMILAVWFKKNLKQAFLNQVYTGKSKVNGVKVDDPSIKEKIYQQYLQAYKKGVFNYIKEEVDQNTQETIPRKYFSGGLVRPSAAMIHTITEEAAQQGISGWQGNTFEVKGEDEIATAGPARNATAAMMVPEEDQRLRQIWASLQQEDPSTPGLSAFKRALGFLDGMPETASALLAMQREDARQGSTLQESLKASLAEGFPLAQQALNILMFSRTTGASAAVLRALTGQNAGAAMTAPLQENLDKSLIKSREIISQITDLFERRQNDLKDAAADFDALFEKARVDLPGGSKKDSPFLFTFRAKETKTVDIRTIMPDITDEEIQALEQRNNHYFFDRSRTKEQSERLRRIGEAALKSGMLGTFFKVTNIKRFNPDSPVQYLQFLQRQAEEYNGHVIFVLSVEESSDVLKGDGAGEATAIAAARKVLGEDFLKTANIDIITDGGEKTRTQNTVSTPYNGLMKTPYGREYYVRAMELLTAARLQEINFGADRIMWTASDGDYVLQQRYLGNRSVAGLVNDSSWDAFIHGPEGTVVEIHEKRNLFREIDEAKKAGDWGNIESVMQTSPSYSTIRKAIGQILHKKLHELGENFYDPVTGQMKFFQEKPSPKEILELLKEFNANEIKPNAFFIEYQRPAFIAQQNFYEEIQPDGNAAREIGGSYFESVFGAQFNERAKAKYPSYFEKLHQILNKSKFFVSSVGVFIDRGNTRMMTESFWENLEELRASGQSGVVTLGNSYISPNVEIRIPDGKILVLQDAVIDSNEPVTLILKGDTDLQGTHLTLTEDTTLAEKTLMLDSNIKGPIKSQGPNVALDNVVYDPKQGLYDIAPGSDGTFERVSALVLTGNEMLSGIRDRNTGNYHVVRGLINQNYKGASINTIARDEKMTLADFIAVHNRLGINSSNAEARGALDQFSQPYFPGGVALRAAKASVIDYTRMSVDRETLRKGIAEQVQRDRREAEASSAMTAQEIGQQFIGNLSSEIHAGKAAEIVIKPDAKESEVIQAVDFLKTKYDVQEVPVAFTLTEAQIDLWYQAAFAYIRSIKSAELAEKDIVAIKRNMVGTPMRVLIVREKNGGKIIFNKEDAQVSGSAYFLDQAKADVRKMFNVDKSDPLNKFHFADKKESVEREMGILNGAVMIDTWLISAIDRFSPVTSGQQFLQEVRQQTETVLNATLIDDQQFVARGLDNWQGSPLFDFQGNAIQAQAARSRIAAGEKGYLYVVNLKDQGRRGIFVGDNDPIPVPRDFINIDQTTGTNGWRTSVDINGDVTKGNLNLYTVGRMAYAWAEHLKGKLAPGEKVIVGFDNRPNSDVFALLFARVLRASGIEVVWSSKATSSPAIMRMTNPGRPENIKYGFLVTASHNSPFDNGIKWYTDGVVMPDPEGIPVTAAVKNIKTFPKVPLSRTFDMQDGEFADVVDSLGVSQQHYEDKFPGLGQALAAYRQNTKAWTIVDQMHGSSGGFAEYLRSLGLEVIQDRTVPMSQMWRQEEFRNKRYNEPGKKEPVPFRPEPKEVFLHERFQEFKAQAPAGSLYFAIDGDADRLAVWIKMADGSIMEVAPNDLGVLYGWMLINDVMKKEYPATGEPTVFYIDKTQPTTTGMDFLVEYGNSLARSTGKNVQFKLRVTPVGSKNFAPEYQNGTLLIGVEESGHIVIKDFFDDAVGQLHFLLKALSASGRSLNDTIFQAKKEVGDAVNVDLNSWVYQRVNPQITPKFTSDFLDPIKAKKPEVALQHLIDALGERGRNIREVRMTTVSSTFETGDVKLMGDYEALRAQGKAPNVKPAEGMILSFNDGSWLMVRVSGTEGLVRVYAEAPSKEDVIAMQKAVVQAFGVAIEFSAAMINNGVNYDDEDAFLTAGDANVYIASERKQGISEAQVRFSSRNPLANLPNTRMQPQTLEGGIDLNSRNLRMESEGQKVNITFNNAMMAQFRRGDFSGVRIQILDVVPINLMPLLGMKEDEVPGQLVKA